MTLQRLPHANCPACPLSQWVGNGPAGYAGPNNPAVIFVGEALGAEEARAHKPFVGASGKLLHGTAALFSQGREYGVTNIVACQPPGNATPDAAMIAACRNRLYAELASLPNDVPLIALGKTAVKVLLPHINRDLKEIDGCWFKTPKGRPVLACYHPAYVIRNGIHYPSFKEAIKRAFSPPVPLHTPESSYVLVDSITELYGEMAYENETIWGGVWQEAVAFDIETTGLGTDDEITCVQLSWNPDRAVIVPRELIYSSSFAGFLGNLFRDFIIVGHNIKFDLLRVMKQLGTPYPARIFDTMLAYYSTNEQGLVAYPSKDQKDSRTKAGFKLKTILKRLFGIEYGHEGDWKVDWNNPKAVADHYEYSALDAQWTLRLYQYLNEEMSEREHKLCQEILFPLNRVLTKIELVGIRFDVAQAKENEAYFTAKANEIELRVRNLVLEELGRQSLPKHILDFYANFKPTQTGKIKALMYDYLGLPVQWLKNKKTGEVKPTTNKAALKALRDIQPENEILPAIMQYRPVVKMRGTYVGSKDKNGNYKSGPLARMDDEDYIHPTFYALNETGRLSSQDPNLQNIPRGGSKTEEERDAKRIKKQYLPDAGHVIVEGDYSQAELRVLALLSMEPSMLAAYEAGVDLHTATSIDIWKAIHGGQDTFMDQDKTTVRDPFRSFVKRANFGIAYRMTPVALCELTWNEMSNEDRRKLHPDPKIAFEKIRVQAEMIHAAWHKTKPNIRPFQEALIAKALEDGYIQTPFGRRRHVGFEPPFGIEKTHLHNELVNFPIQSIGSADLGIVAMIRLDAWIEETGFPARILTNVHDSIVSSCLCDPETVKAFIAKKKEIMLGVVTEFLGDEIPFGVDFKVGKSWGEAIEWEIVESVSCAIQTVFGGLYA